MFTITNVVSRLATIFSPLIVEVMQNSIITVTMISLLGFSMTFVIKKVYDDLEIVIDDKVENEEEI